MCLIKLKGNSFLSMTKNFTHNRNQPCIKEQITFRNRGLLENLLLSICAGNISVM